MSLYNLYTRIIRTSLFKKIRTTINMVYKAFNVLKLNDFFQLKVVKFMYKFENHMLPFVFITIMIK